MRNPEYRNKVKTRGSPAMEDVTEWLEKAGVMEGSMARYNFILLIHIS